MLFEKRKVFHEKTVLLNDFNFFGKPESRAVILFQTKKTFLCTKLKEDEKEEGEYCYDGLFEKPCRF